MFQYHSIGLRETRELSFHVTKIVFVKLYFITFDMFIAVMVEVNDAYHQAWRDACYQNPTGYRGT